MNRAVCTWGDGPDVDLEVKNVFMLEPVTAGASIHGSVPSGQIDLTAEEAVRLGHELIKAGEQSKLLTFLQLG
jgi:hypothetical protein